MKLKCESKAVNLRLDCSEKNSMLIVGGSRMGKTFFASNLAASLIMQGYCVHLIDLGDKWCSEDKQRLCSAGAHAVQVEQEGIELVFQNDRELLDCAKHIANALGIQSAGAITALKSVIKLFISTNIGSFQMKDIVGRLNSDNQQTPDEKEWSEKLYARLDSCSAVPNIRFRVEPAGIFSNKSTIWELSGLDDVYIQLVTYLILYCLFCQQRYYFRSGVFVNKSFIPKNLSAYSTFAIVDEFQNLDCNRRAIIGTCLTEGQKYKMSLILITQFLMDNFSEAVITQFKQGGYRFYFRLTEEESSNVSRQLAYEIAECKKISQKLTKLPVGHCLMMGTHSLENRNDVSENFRFVQVIEEPIDNYSRYRRGMVFAP